MSCKLLWVSYSERLGSVLCSKCKINRHGLKALFYCKYSFHSNKRKALPLNLYCHDNTTEFTGHKSSWNVKCTEIHLVSVKQTTLLGKQNKPSTGLHV